ncbi:FCD domain-containing protein [Mesorhizobium microcysteis]|jgi:DNA-binding GntR family transcriptional regulator|uniref:FCD domain-containing protein n=1 Tax=Neoaquamicrobium microcysteis TaxID=2682781 RepID=A0A5D4GPH9_9HYPH|nr:FCD domain-containing protein [Mesorhizobium microcysteis]TYR30751.1 FCD domain-containing protein [Mesorhizobium microcysteis]
MYQQLKTDRSDLTILRTSSLTGALERELEHLILTGELKPGERLNEIQISTRFGTSRGPLREATRSLQAKGLVDIIRNRGVFVRSVSPKEALEIYDVRAAIFGLAGRLLADLVTDPMLTKLNGYLDKMDEIAAVKDFDQYYPVNLAFHDYLVTATGNETLVKEYKGFVNKLHLARARGLVQAGGLSVSNREHREMVDALASGNRERAQESFFRHVERSKIRFRSTLDADAEAGGGGSN